MPAVRVHAVVVRRVLTPVVEVTVGDTGRVLVVADRRVGDGREAPEELVRLVPVEELGTRALLVDVAEIEEQVRVPARDQVRDIGGGLVATRTVTHGGEDEGLARCRIRPRRRSQRAVVLRLGRVAVREVERDVREVAEVLVAHPRLHREGVRAVDEFLGRQQEGVRRLVGTDRRG